MWITPYSQRSCFGRSLTFDDKVKIFYEQTLGWQLDIADACINGRDFQGTKDGPIKHSGYAVLHIVLSYFEMIAKMKDGYTQDYQAKRYFKKGVRDVFPDLSQYGANLPDDQDALVKILYHSARCGLYHAGITAGRIKLLGKKMPALTYDEKRRYLTINPHNLVLRLKEHFEDYVNDLRQPSNVPLRENFERRFDYLGSRDPLRHK